jgi:hypothetical protein
MVGTLRFAQKMFDESREPASVFAAAGPGWMNLPSWEEDGGWTPARACRSCRPTGADSPREDFENSSDLSFTQA